MRERLLTRESSDRQYAKYKCFNSTKLNKESEDDDCTSTPIFESKEQFDEFHSAKAFSGNVYFLTCADLPADMIEQTIVTISKAIMLKVEYFDYLSDIDHLADFTRSKLKEIIKKPLMKKTQEYYRDNCEKLFFGRFKADVYFVKVLETCYDYLEKSKNYDLSILVLCCLIYTQPFSNKLQKWLHRLAVDLKHTKLIIESF